MALKVVHVSDTDIQSGAGKAAYRIHQSMRKLGIESTMLVGKKEINDESVKSLLRNKIDKLKQIFLPYFNSRLSKFYKRKNEELFSSTVLTYGNLSKQKKIQDADIVILYWIAGGLFKPSDLLFINKPIIWRLSDMWSFTGGCHYSGSCIKYQENCGACPSLGSNVINDLSRQEWKRKEKIWKKLDLTVVAPSRWMAECVRKSSLLAKSNIEYIATGVDLSSYKLIDKVVARNLMGFSVQKKLIAFGALSATADKRKGFPQLISTLKCLCEFNISEKCELVVFGSSFSDMNLPMPAHFLGRLHDDIALNLLYSAIDVFVLPSLEENLANVVLEAMACKTPIVAFDIGGTKDAVVHKKTGYLARPYDVDDLALGIKWALEDDERLEAISINARQKINESFSQSSQVEKYLNLINKIVLKNHG